MRTIDFGTPTRGRHALIGTSWAHTAPDVRASPLKSSDGTQWARLMPAPSLLASSAQR